MTLTIAHRGEPVGHVENTCESVSAAIAAGADMVEIDIRLTSDGVPVLLHDDSLSRIWGRRRRIGALSAADVAQLRGPGGTGIPTLAEVAVLAADAGRQLMVDLPQPEAITAAHRILADLKMMPQCLFAGRSRWMREKMPHARLALSWDSPTVPNAGALAFFQPEYFNPDFRLLTAGIADRMHEAGLLVSVWTVDHPRDMAAAITQGADAVITNRIADLVSLVGATA